MSPGEGWVSASWMELGAPRATQRSVASVTPCASTAARTPSAIRRPSRLIRRSIAKATGTSRIAMLEASPAILMSRSGAWPVPLLMSCSRPEVVPCANAAMASSTTMASTPTSSRMRSEGRCTRAGSSGSSPSTSSGRRPWSPVPGSVPVGAFSGTGAPSTGSASSSRARVEDRCTPSSLLAAPVPPRPVRAVPGRAAAPGVPSAPSGCTPCSFMVSS